ncbi:hypothetical protein LCGC14_2733690, partial [marine sediment metagenome]
MSINLSTHPAFDVVQNTPVTAKPPSLAAPGTVLDVAQDAAQDAAQDDGQLRETFDAFVGQTFFAQMLKAMRKTVGKSAYFHGGRAEEIFQQQLDQVLGEKLAKASGDKLSRPMFELFRLN